MELKRVAAIHDISCFGKCSLTVALPIISACGIETAVIPTAVLSTHTGGFSGFTFRDLSEDIVPIANHWEREGIAVDGVYTGYLGSKEQIEIVKKIIPIIKKTDGITIVDPVMADHGKLYGGFPQDFPDEMKKLCAVADIITPNITEACLMVKEEYKAGPYTKEYIENLILKLSEITNAKIVLTGVTFDNKKIGAAIYADNHITYIFSNYIDATYHGTGDVFASTLVGALMGGKNLEKATAIASDFTADCVKNTKENHPLMKYSVDFETIIQKLINYLK